jgi:hypothetical protein
MESSENTNSVHVNLNLTPEVSIIEFFDKFKFKNKEFIKSMDKLDELVDAHQITGEDIETLNGFNIKYDLISLPARDFRSQVAEMQKSIMESTLKEAFDRSMLFFGDTDPEDLSNYLNHYKIKFLQKGVKTEFMLDYISILEMNLNRFRSEYQMQVFFDHPIDLSSMFNIQRISFEAQYEPDLLIRKKIFVDAKTECELFCLGLSLTPLEESIYQEIITTCTKAIEVIDFHFQNSPQDVNSVNDNSPKYMPAAPRFRLAPKKKTDFIKIVSAMYDARMFETEDGYIASNKKEIMHEFGRMLGEDFELYSSFLTQAKMSEKKTFLKPFKEIEKKAEDYYDNEC